MAVYKELNSSVGMFSEGVKDQYADGKAARVWKKFVGDCDERTQKYKDFLIDLLKTHNCVNILDAACGTGIDSMMLIDEGFKVMSTDASDKMLKYALKARWERRKNSKYDEWVIEEANWETLYRDVQRFQPGAQFDAVLCLGNSFAHLLDEWGDQREQLEALRNFVLCLKPGGLLIIDHRNYDVIIDSGATSEKNVYFYSKHPVEIKTSMLVMGGRPEVVILDYCIDAKSNDVSQKCEFRLCGYPHKLERFKSMLQEVFGARSLIRTYADFRPLEEEASPAFYIHVVQKKN